MCSFRREGQWRKNSSQIVSMRTISRSLYSQIFDQLFIDTAARLIFIEAENEITFILFSLLVKAKIEVGNQHRTVF
jgi:hypothetical protein